MGPERWQQFFLPGLRRLVNNVKEIGCPFIKHCDGNITSIVSDLVDTGVDCIDPIDAEAGMQLARIKAEYGHRVAIKGGLPVGSILSRGTVDEVEWAVKQCLQDAGIGGGYILSSSSDILASVKPENYLAMLDALKKYGSYPLNLDRLGAT